MKNDFNKYHRYRGIQVGFRVTKEENEMIDRMVMLSGMTKQDYIRTRLECKDIMVVRNPRVYLGTKRLLKEIKEKLETIECGDGSFNPELHETIRIVASALGEMKDDKEIG